MPEIVRPRESAATDLTVSLADSSLREAVIRLFEQIAEAEGWQPEGQLRSEGERSTYLALQEAGGEVVGGIQIVSCDTAGRLPAHRVWPELPAVTDSTVAHVSVLAIAQEWRRRGAGRREMAFWMLGIALWRHCAENSVRDLWLEATPRMLRAYRLLGMPLVVQGPLRIHWGEECYPCRLSVREVAGAITERALTSSVYRALLVQAITPVSACLCVAA